MNSWTISRRLRPSVLVMLALVLAVSAWAQEVEQKLVPSDGAPGDAFGGAVSLQGDRALVGAHHSDPLANLSGSAYIYERQEDGSWLEVAKLTASDGDEGDSFGRSVSLSEDRTLIGSYHDAPVSTGASYVYERQGNGTWLEVAKLVASDGGPGDFYGRSGSLEGGRAIVGAPGTWRSLPGDDRTIPAAYVYERQGNGSWLEVAKLAASDAT